MKIDYDNYNMCIRIPVDHKNYPFVTWHEELRLMCTKYTPLQYCTYLTFLAS